MKLNLTRLFGRGSKDATKAQATINNIEAAATTSVPPPVPPPELTLEEKLQGELQIALDQRDHMNVAGIYEQLGRIEEAVDVYIGHNDHWNQQRFGIPHLFEKSVEKLKTKNNDGTAAVMRVLSLYEKHGYLGYALEPLQGFILKISLEAELKDKLLSFFEEKETSSKPLHPSWRKYLVQLYRTLGEEEKVKNTWLAMAGDSDQFTEAVAYRKEAGLTPEQALSQTLRDKKYHSPWGLVKIIAHCKEQFSADDQEYVLGIVQSWIYARDYEHKGEALELLGLTREAAQAYAQADTYNNAPAHKAVRIYSALGDEKECVRVALERGSKVLEAATFDEKKKDAYIAQLHFLSKIVDKPLSTDQALQYLGF